MPDDELQAEFQDLLEAACESQLDSASTARLGELLRGNAERRRKYLHAMRTCALLERFSERIEEWIPPSLARETIARTSPHVAHPLKRAVNYLSHPVRFGFLFACSATFFLVTLMAMLHVPANVKPDRESPTPDEIAPLARVTAVHDCAWVGQETPRLKAPLKSGEILQLASGMAEITFRSGATVLLQGASRFQVNSSVSGGLLLGKISVNVPPKAQGYKIVTPTVVIIDLGTQFGVEVAPDGGAELRVFSGQVEVQPHRQAPRLRVAGDQSRKWSPQGQLLPNPPQNAEKFALEIPVEYARQTRRIAQAPHADALAFEAEDFAWLRGRDSGWKRITKDNPLVTPSGDAALPLDSNASQGAALVDDFGEPHPYSIESAAGYRLQFRTTGRYRVYLRYSMYENAAPGAPTFTDYHHENSAYLPTNFGRRPALLVHFGPNSDGAPYLKSERQFEGRYYWQATSAVYQIDQETLHHELQWQIGDREAGFSLDRIVFSTQTGLTDRQLDQIPNSLVQITSD